MRLLPALKYDILFQIKQGIYYLYTGITVLYAILLYFIDNSIKSDVSVLMIISDPILLGFFFIGGIVLLEKDNNILQALFVTPLKVNEYIISKSMSLFFITLVCSIIIGIIGFRKDINLFLFVLTICISSSTFTFLGMAIASSVNSLNEYMFISSCFEIILFSPLVSFFGIFDTFLFRLIPSDAVISLIKSSINNRWTEAVFPLLVLIIWCISFYYIAKKSIFKNIIVSIGDEK